MKKMASITIAVLLVVVSTAVAVHFSSQKTSPPKPYDSGEPEADMASILACYPGDTASTTEKPIPNNSIQSLKETSRIFINMPKALYPEDLRDSWTTVAGNATAGSIGSGFGEAEGAPPGCWSSYMDFEGSGEVDLRVKSVVEGAPDYFVRFIVSS